MNRLLLTIFLFFLYTATSTANDKRECSKIHPLTRGEQILNAIGDGKVAELVVCGLQINAPITIQGVNMTPLEFASTLGKPSIVEQLIKAGADPNFSSVTNGVILYPLELALASSKYDVAIVLLNNKARADYFLPHSGTTALMTLTFDKKFDEAAQSIVKYLIKYGADINAADSKGNTALHWAARTGNDKYVSVLLDSGASACIKNKKGQIPSETMAKKNELESRLLSNDQCPP